MSEGNGEIKKGINTDERLLEIETRIKELEPLKNIENDKSKEVRKELASLYNEKITLTTKPQEAPKDFKIAEIWIRESQLILDASPEFWMDKLRALGVLEMCKDIVKQYNAPKPKIDLVDKGGFKRFVNGLKRRF